METIILTKPQAAALATVKRDYGNEIESLVNYHVNHVWTSEHLQPLNELDLNTLLEAYFKGYKIELSKEEQILEIYTRIENEEGDEFHAGMLEGIKLVIRVLELKIKGINI
jgi:hypothetical protein